MGSRDDRSLMSTNKSTSSGRIQHTPRTASEYGKVNFIEHLNSDKRPTFVLDLSVYSIEDTLSNPLVFSNSALLNSKLYDVVYNSFERTVTDWKGEDKSTFATWITNQFKSRESKTSKVFFDTLWTKTILPEEWMVVSGVELSNCDLESFNNAEESASSILKPPDAFSRNSSSTSITQSQSKKSSRHSRAPLGGVSSSNQNDSSAHITWVREFDWESTSLGPIETWSPQLRQACEMMLANPDPTTIFWGPDLILIYNEAYVGLAGNKHPNMMGGSARVHWKEVWDQYDPLFENIRKDGKAFKQENTQLFTHRRDYLEEGFFNLMVVPLMGDDGSVVGFYEPVTEVTKQTLSERRMHTLLKFSECTSSATSLKDLWRLLLEVLNGHRSEIQFSLLYHLEHAKPSNSSPQFNLEGSVGLDADKNSFPKSFKIDDMDQDGIITPLQQAHESRNMIVLKSSDETLSPSILQQIKSSGTIEAPRTCIVHPLSSSVDESIEAFLVLGISPFRPYDEDYELFVNLLVRQVENTLNLVTLFEKERESLRQQALLESELRFKRFAESAQVGIFSFDPVGNITFCNESWLELSGHDRNDMSAMSWTNDVHPDNINEIKKYWDKIARNEGQQTFEVQYKKPWKPTHLNDDSISLDRTWVVASAYAEVSDDGELTAIVGCCTDISSWKWVERIQSERLNEALELKRQQENFLDFTSHEMRNPLNAMLHCASELIEPINELLASNITIEQTSILQDCLEASRTIMYCGRHQKRIIDDVLTLSKLGLNLLDISPIETRPLDVVEEVLKVFDTELRASSIQTKVELSESYQALQIEAVLIDAHRVIQILINLVANAIKFTKGESLRNLQVVIGAYTTEPESSDTGVRYVSSERRPADPTDQIEWGTGEIVFLHFSVKDTGPGMSREEADLLFNRFAQGSPRTHVQYGGSGLGLFISRELAELHGGRIGISSELGFGSTFDFYVKGRRSKMKHSRMALKNPGGNTSFSRTSILDRHMPDAPPTLMHSSKSSPSVLLRPRSTNVHILIVEDNLINQKILAKLMVKQGYEVSIANHGEEALAMIHTSTWSKSHPLGLDIPLKLDLVLADIEMPVMDGKVFVQNIRRLQNEGTVSGDIPVIAVTGNARSEQVQVARDCGFDDVVTKPYSVEDLVFKIKRFTATASMDETTS